MPIDPIVIIGVLQRRIAELERGWAYLRRNGLTGVGVRSGNIVGIVPTTVLQDSGSHALKAEVGASVMVNPGTAYVEASSNLRASVPFGVDAPGYVRIVVAQASGNEAGSSKGLQVWNVTDSAAVCEVTWNGTGAADRAGAWTATALAADKMVTLRVKGSSATEDMTFGAVHLEWRRN